MFKAKLFYPTEQDQRVQYPELAEVSEFKNLTQKQMNFVWAMACDSSPYKRLPPNKRVVKAVEILMADLTPIQLKSYSEQKYPDTIKVALERMEKFELTIRMRTKLMVQKMLEDHEKIVFDGIKDDATYEEKQKYVTTMQVINKTLPSLVKSNELGYGVVIEETDKSPEEEDNTPIKWDDIVNKQKKP